MSIDEAIAKYKEITNKDAICPAHCNISCDKCVQESEQLAEWLEELKELRETSCGYSKEDIELNRTAMYNKALDDFAEKLKSECREHYIDCDPYFGGITDSILYEDDIEEIAEQLKVGGENNLFKTKEEAEKYCVDVNTKEVSGNENNLQEEKIYGYSRKA